MAWPNVYNLDAGRFKQETARPAQTTLVLVHDAFHTPLHFEQLVRQLRQAGYDVVIPYLPSCHLTQESDPLQADIHTIFNHCRPVIEAGRSVVLVLHGYSAIPGSIAAERLNQYALTRPRAGFVDRLIFFSAIILDASECLLDITRPEWLVSENGILKIRRPDQVFFQDCPHDVTRTAVSLIRPQLADSFHSRVTSAGWRDIPCVYIVCESDQAFPRSVQQACLSKLQASNRRSSALSLRSGHSPFLSRPTETAALIMQCVNSS